MYVYGDDCVMYGFYKIQKNFFRGWKNSTSVIA